MGPAPDALDWMVDAGAVGVSAFFCLSGFILAYCYGDHRFQTWRCYFAFIGRRCARLLPVYWLSQLMCVGVEVNSVKAYGWDVWSVLHWLSLATGTNTWWPWPESDLLRGAPMLNGTLYALSFVLFFYVACPPLMRAMRWCVGVERLSELPNSKSTFRLLLLWLLCIASMWPLMLATLHDADGVFAWKIAPYPRMGEFGLGLVTAALYISIRNRRQQLANQQLLQGADEVRAQPQYTLIERLAQSPLLHSPLTLDIVMAASVLLVMLLALPSLRRPSFMQNGNWLAPVISLIILLLALSDSADGRSASRGVVGWLLTRPITLELGAMSFCFYAFHMVPVVYSLSIGLPLQQSAAVEFCAAVGLAWLGYKYVETLVYAALSSRLPVCRCHKG